MSNATIPEGYQQNVMATGCSKRETLIEVENLNIDVIKEPDALVSCDANADYIYV